MKHGLKVDIENIDGGKLIDFINNNREDDDACIGYLTFELHKIEKDYLGESAYVINFSSSFNNWGETQEISHNYIRISQNDHYVGLNEPFDGDESSDILEDLILDFLKKCDFSKIDNTSKLSDSLIEISEKVKNIKSYNDLDNVISELHEIKKIMPILTK